MYRPAAIDQLHTLGQQVEVGVYGDAASKDVVGIVKQGIVEAGKARARTVIVDTAGRLQIDDEMMGELKRLKAAVSPHEILLVADGMTGQDAVRIAQGFHDALGVTGVILTKMDGDARGGAALSIYGVTKAPIKYIGVGEKLDALEPFHPDRLAGRILQQGDILSLVEKAQGAVDEKEAERLAKKVTSKKGMDLERLPQRHAPDAEDGAAQERARHAARDEPGHAAGGQDRRQEAQARRSHRALDDAQGALESRTSSTGSGGSGSPRAAGARCRK